MIRARERLAEQQRLRELHDGSKRWVWCAVVSGLTCGLGNYFMGVNLANTGMMGPGFTGPLGLIILLSYRAVQACRSKKKHGKFVNFKKSNWFTTLGRFKRRNLIPLAGNFIPNLLGLVFISMGFKFAALGDLNQGILPTLTSLAGVYCSILFYFKFNEIISLAQFVGMFLMIVSVVFLGLEGASVGSNSGETQLNLDVSGVEDSSKL